MNKILLVCLKCFRTGDKEGDPPQDGNLDQDKTKVFKGRKEGRKPSCLVMSDGYVRKIYKPSRGLDADIKRDVDLE